MVAETVITAFREHGTTASATGNLPLSTAFPRTLPPGNERDAIAVSRVQHEPWINPAPPDRASGGLSGVIQRLAISSPMCYMLYMTSVGVRELRQRASELLRLVALGETVEITDRGRPVARLTPLPDGTPLEQMRSSGEVDSASADIDDLPEPIVLASNVESPTTALRRLRSSER
jgi:prevent-host-death family protein